MIKLIRRHRQTTAKKALAQPAAIFTITDSDLDALELGRL